MISEIRSKIATVQETGIVGIPDYIETGEDIEIEAGNGERAIFIEGDGPRTGLQDVKVGTSFYYNPEIVYAAKLDVPLEHRGEMLEAWEQNGLRILAENRREVLVFSAKPNEKIGV